MSEPAKREVATSVPAPVSVSTPVPAPAPAMDIAPPASSATTSATSSTPLPAAVAEPSATNAKHVEEGSQPEAKAANSNNNVTPSGPSELDLVFCMDCTGSMGSYIASAQQNIISIVEKIVASEKVDVQFGLVAYRDHPPQDSSFVTKVFDFTSSRKTMEANVRSLSAAGGGDGPEAVTAGLHAVLKMPYRKDSTRIAVIIADAPPHGLGESGDGFPNGDPNGLDPIQIAKQMLENNITLYSVACEPSITSSYKFAVDFFDAIAKITGGKFLPLTSAKLLADVIVGTASEEISLAKLMADLEKEIEEQKNNSKKPLTDEDLTERVHTAMAAKGFKSRHVEVDAVYDARDCANVDVMFGSESLSEARRNFKEVAKPVLSSVATGSAAASHAPKAAAAPRKGSGLFSMFSRSRDSEDAKLSTPMPSAPMAAPAMAEAEELLDAAPVTEQRARVETASISKSQVTNMMRKAKAQHKY